MNALVGFLAQAGAKEVAKSFAPAQRFAPGLFKDGAREQEALNARIAQLSTGQLRIEEQLADVKQDVLRGDSPISLYNVVKGLMRVVEADNASDATRRRLVSFLDVTGKNSAMDIGDELSQRFFGINQGVPVWLRSPEPPVWSPLGDTGLVAARSSALFANDGRVVSLARYVDAMNALYLEVMGYFTYLGLAMKIVHDYLQREGMWVDRKHNPALFKGDGIADLVRVPFMDYIVSTAPDAFAVHTWLTKQTTPQKIAFKTKVNGRILECDDSGRRVASINNTNLEWERYEVEKSVFADHKDLDEKQPNHWWFMSPVAGADPGVCTFRTAKNGSYLGVFTHYAQEIDVSTRDYPYEKVGKRCEWKMHLCRPKGQKVTYFVLENLHAHTCLLITGRQSSKYRQILLQGPPDDHADKLLLIASASASLPMGSYGASTRNVRLILQGVFRVPGSETVTARPLEAVPGDTRDIVIDYGTIAYTDKVVTPDEVKDLTSVRAGRKLGDYMPLGSYLRGVPATEGLSPEKVSVVLRADCQKPDRTWTASSLDITDIDRFTLIHNDKGQLCAERGKVRPSGGQQKHPGRGGG